MKKKIFGLFAMMMVALVSVSLVSCGDDDSDSNGGGGSFNLSEAQIREYLESGSGTWEITEIDEGETFTHTMYFIDGKTNGWRYTGSSTMVKYSISGNKVYNDGGIDVLEGGIVLNQLTATTLKGYWGGNQANSITGLKISSGK